MAEDTVMASTDGTDTATAGPAVEHVATTGDRAETSTVPLEDNALQKLLEEAAQTSTDVASLASAQAAQEQAAESAADAAAPATSIDSTDVAPVTAIDSTNAASVPPPQDKPVSTADDAAALTLSEAVDDAFAETAKEEASATTLDAAPPPADSIDSASLQAAAEQPASSITDAAPVASDTDAAAAAQAEHGQASAASVEGTKATGSTSDDEAKRPDDDQATADAAVSDPVTSADVNATSASQAQEKAAAGAVESAPQTSVNGTDAASSALPAEEQRATSDPQGEAAPPEPPVGEFAAQSGREVAAPTTADGMDIDPAPAKLPDEQMPTSAAQDAEPTSTDRANAIPDQQMQQEGATGAGDAALPAARGGDASSTQPTQERTPATAVPDAEATRQNVAEAPTADGASRVRREEAAPASTVSRARRENEDLRLMWLSLPSHDHPTYYSDTDGEASSSSSIADALEPRSVAGRTPYLSGRLGRASGGNVGGKRKNTQDDWRFDDNNDDDRDSSDDDAEAELYRQAVEHEKMYRVGNRGNKLRKNARWVRNGKLGTASEARKEKDIHERFTARLKALQRSQVESLLHVVEGPQLAVNKPDMLEGSDRLLLRDAHLSLPVEESSTLLAPQLLRPILSARALLQSHTLRHTFRNPHIGALSRTALDLRESESCLSRALAQCLGSMEKAAAATRSPNGTTASETLPRPQASEQVNNGRIDKNVAIDPQTIGMEGTHATSDELNPAFSQLDRLFVTNEGLPIPLGGAGESEDGQMLDEQQTNEVGDVAAQQHVLSPAQQRDVIRAALECLYELGADSLEYVERLDEARTRLAAVKQKRMQVWNALRRWALKREGEDPDAKQATHNGSGGGSGVAKGGADLTAGSAVPTVAAAEAVSGGRSSGGGGGGHSRSSGGRSGKRQRV